MATPLPPVGRRQFLRTSILAACALGAPFLMQCSSKGDAAIFVKEPLPYPQDALAPSISARTMEFHYGKHYAGYVQKANRLAAGKSYAGKSPQEVIRLTAGDPARAAVFNNAAQAWNHAFFFKCLTPDGGGEPEGHLAEMIEATFGSFVDFKEVFLTAAGDHFGSGWVWLVLDAGKLAVVAGDNADTPYAHDLTPLFTIDLWEHAYYLDYQNRRLEYVRSVLDHVANWGFVSAQFDEGMAAGE
jgi:Fe-Mn family superoxide dismutase